MKARDLLKSHPRPGDTSLAALRQLYNLSLLHYQDGVILQPSLNGRAGEPRRSTFRLDCHALHALSR